MDGNILNGNLVAKRWKSESRPNLKVRKWGGKRTEKRWKSGGNPTANAQSSLFQRLRRPSGVLKQHGKSTESWWKNYGKILINPPIYPVSEERFLETGLEYGKEAEKWRQKYEKKRRKPFSRVYIRGCLAAQCTEKNENDPVVVCREPLSAIKRRKFQGLPLIKSSLKSPAYTLYNICIPYHPSCSSS